MKIQGWIIKPPDFDPTKKYPLKLHIHGGPHCMYNVGFNFGWQDRPPTATWCSTPIRAAAPATAATFGNEIKNAYPGKDFDDLMAGVDDC